MRKIILFSVFIVILLAVTGNVFAQRGSAAAETLEVRIASPLPAASPWGRTLDRIAAEWSRVTNGQVRLRALHGGTEGSEDKMMLSLAGNTIQAALLTSFGLSSIEPSILTVSSPFLIRNDEELAVVMRELQGGLETRINSGNYFILAWSQAGFVHVFSREPVIVPADLRRLRIGSNSEASDLNNIFKAMGYQIVEADWGDVGNMLNAGQISAIYQNPAAIAAVQLHTVVRNMLPVNIAPVIGGIVINQQTWRRIGQLNPRYQTELLRATRRIAEEFDATMPRTINDAIQSMSRTGLTVNRLSPAQEQQWYSEFERAMPSLLGTAFDIELYQNINNILIRHRGGR